MDARPTAPENLMSVSSNEPLSIRDLALMIGVSEEVVRSWVEAGVLPYRREDDTPVFDRIAVERWLEEKANALFGEDF